MRLEPGKHRLTDQRVGKREPAGAVVVQQAGGDGRIGGIEEAVGVEVGSVGENGQRGHRFGDSCDSDDVGDGPVETVEAGTDHRRSPTREFVVGTVVGMGDQLGDEERVSAGGGVQLAGIAPRRGRAARSSSIDVGRVEPVER